MFVFRKENQFVHVYEHFSFLELPGINGVDATKSLIPSGCLIYVSPLASHFRGA